MTGDKITSGYVEPVSQKEIEALGVKPRSGAAPLERGEDILQRYIRIPNRIFFVYTTEDEVISSYITSNWAALDGLSGEICDIYTSVLQLENEEDAYSFADDIKGIPGSEFIRIDNLPCILLWSDYAALSLSVKDIANELHVLRLLLRKIFVFLRGINRGIMVEDRQSMSAIIDEVNGESGFAWSEKVVINGDVIMNTEYKADRGGVILGDNAKARDIATKSSNQKNNKNAVDMIELANQLGILRKRMKDEADGENSEHDIAIGNVARAESAAKSGDKKGASEALKSVGNWALGIAGKIGVDVATSAIKESLNMPS